MVRKMFIFMVIMILAAGYAYAGTVDLPKTGQTTIYGTDDDGTLQKGVEWPNPRFTVGTGAEINCVTDNLTGLMWVKAPDSVARIWADALAYANGSSLCGHTDWRLPNVNELGSLINAGQSNTAAWLNDTPQGFSNVQQERYWSSTTHPLLTDYAWGVGMRYGHVNLDYKDNSADFYVWTVRGTTTAPAELPKTGQTTFHATGDDGEIRAGVAWPTPRFIDNLNGTVTDKLTGLIWLKNANCFGAKTWTNSLDDANALKSGECGLSDSSEEGDWHLPNRKELRSLIHYEQSNTATWLNTQGFSNVQSHSYWSSTTDAYGIGNAAWNVSMWHGHVNDDGKVYDYYVWPVRAGSGGSFYNLVISKAGTGTGTVTSNPVGIDCGGTCDADFAENTPVTLTPAASTGSTFTGWSGDCDSSGQVTMNANKTCTATFALNTYTVAVNPSGIVSAGQTVTITSNAGGVNCTWNGSAQGGTCTSSALNHGSSVTLTATLPGGTTISWGAGCNASTATTCTISSLTANTTISPVTTVATYTVTTTAANGTITSTNNPTVNHGSTTTVTGSANANYYFTGVSGCGGITQSNTDQSVTTFSYTTGAVTSDCTVTADFNLILQRTLTVTKAGTGTGNVTAGANCTLSWTGNTGTCTVNSGTAITLSGSANAGSIFAGWSGGTGSASACTGTGNCAFNITADSGVAATFTLNQYTVTTTATNGTITSTNNPTVNHGSTTIVTGTANANYYFTGVSGCGGTTQNNTNQSVTTFSYTTVAVTSNCTVTATFAIKTYTVTPSAGAGGIINPSTPQTANHGATTQFTVTPNAGYIALVGGTCGGSLVGNTYTTSAIIANCTVTATFNLTYSISGKVTTRAVGVGSGTPISGVTITLSGAASGTTTTDGNGNYTFTLPNGNYTVAPSRAGYAFTPISRGININNANVTGQNFTGTITGGAPTFLISGTITSGGSPLVGVSVALTGAANATAVTNASGVYTFAGLSNGNYTVTPSLAGFTFAPVNKAVAITNANVTGQDFIGTGAAGVYSISGTVRTRALGASSGTPISGVTITLSGAASGTTTTDGNGNYSLTGLANGNYTVTPSQTGFTFTPANRPVTINNANAIGQNFTRN